jgi:hypothetical protein
MERNEANNEVGQIASTATNMSAFVEWRYGFLYSPSAPRLRWEEARTLLNIDKPVYYSAELASLVTLSGKLFKDAVEDAEYHNRGREPSPLQQRPPHQQQQQQQQMELRDMWSVGLQFIRLMLKELRIAICSPESRTSMKSDKAALPVLVSGLGSSIAVSLGVTNAVATGLCGIGLVVIARCAHKAFCDMTDDEVMKVIASHVPNAD